MKYITIITFVIIFIMAVFHEVNIISVPALDTVSEVIRG